MCNASGANAQNDIVAILQSMASATSAICSAANRQATQSSNGSDSTWLLQKIFDAQERNSMEMKTQLNECLEAIKNTSKTVDNLKERLDGVEQKIDKMCISGSESNRETDRNISKVEKSISEKLAEHLKKAEERNEETIGELLKLRQQHEETQKLIQSNWEKASSLMEALNHDLTEHQQCRFNGIEKQLETIRNEVKSTNGNLEKQQNMLSNVLQETNEIRKEQDTTPKPSSSSALVPAETKVEDEVNLVIHVTRFHQSRRFVNPDRVVLKVKLTDSVDSIRAHFKYEKRLEDGLIYDCLGTRIDESGTIGEQGIHLWKEGRLRFQFWVGV